MFVYVPFCPRREAFAGGDGSPANGVDVVDVVVVDVVVVDVVVVDVDVQYFAIG